MPKPSSPPRFAPGETAEVWQLHDKVKRVHGQPPIVRDPKFVCEARVVKVAPLRITVEAETTQGKFWFGYQRVGATWQREKYGRFELRKPTKGLK